jgi:hypothetical protein
MPDSSNRDNEPVVEGLKEHGLFHVFLQETVTDKAANTRLPTMMTDVIMSGSLDRLTRRTRASDLDRQTPLNALFPAGR